MAYAFGGIAATLREWETSVYLDTERRETVIRRLEQFAENPRDDSDFEVIFDNDGNYVAGTLGIFGSGVAVTMAVFHPEQRIILSQVDDLRTRRRYATGGVTFLDETTSR
jgi:hypothetical protein